MLNFMKINSGKYSGNYIGEQQQMFKATIKKGQDLQVKLSARIDKMRKSKQSTHELEASYLWIEDGMKVMATAGTMAETLEKMRNRAIDPPVVVIDHVAITEEEVAKAHAQYTKSWFGLYSRNETPQYLGG